MITIKSKKVKNLIILILLLIYTNLNARVSSDDYSYALDFYSKKKYDYTLKLLNKILKIDNTDLKASCLKASCLMELHNYNESLDILTQLSIIHPHEGNIYFLKAFTEWRLLRYKKAHESISLALEYQPDNKFSYFLMAIISYELQLFADAKSNFDIANNISEELSPNNEAKKRLIRKFKDLYLVQHRILESMSVGSGSGNHKLWFYKAMFKAITNDNWSALIDFDKAIDLNGKEELHHYFKSYTLAMVKKYDLAYACITNYSKNNDCFHNHDEFIHPLKKILDITKIHLSENQSDVMVLAEKMPQFGNDPQMLAKYINENIKYPEQALMDGLQGTVVVDFYIDQQGYIKNISILKSMGGGCDKEVFRVIQNMPKWNPGMHLGKPVKVKFTLPVKFKM